MTKPPGRRVPSIAIPEPPPAPAETYEGQGDPLNFRVSPAFRQRFRVYAVTHNLRQSKLLVMAFEALLRERG